jgi:hypothetical protein
MNDITPKRPTAASSRANDPKETTEHAFLLVEVVNPFTQQARLGDWDARKGCLDCSPQASGDVLRIRARPCHHRYLRKRRRRVHHEESVRRLVRSQQRDVVRHHAQDMELSRRVQRHEHRLTDDVNATEESAR